MANYIDCKKIELSFLKKKGIFKSPSAISIKWDTFIVRSDLVEDLVVVQKPEDKDYIEIGYVLCDFEGERKKVQYPIKLLKVPSNWNGYRYYFECPLKLNGLPCRRKILILYKPNEHFLFGCRHCHQIKYPTQIINKRHPQYTNIKKLLLENKINKLEGGRRFYKGKKTKRQNKLERFQNQIDGYPETSWTKIR